MSYILFLLSVLNFTLAINPADGTDRMHGVAQTISEILYITEPPRDVTSITRPTTTSIKPISTAETPTSTIEKPTPVDSNINSLTEMEMKIHAGDGDICASQVQRFLCKKGRAECLSQCRGDDFVLSSEKNLNLDGFQSADGVKCYNGKDYNGPTLEEFFEIYTFDDIRNETIPRPEPFSAIMNCVIPDTAIHKRVGKMIDYITQDNNRLLFTPNGPVATSSAVRYEWSNKKIPWDILNQNDPRCKDLIGFTEFEEKTSKFKGVKFCFLGGVSYDFDEIYTTVVHELGHVRDSFENKLENKKGGKVSSPFRGVCRDMDTYSMNYHCSENSFVSVYAKSNWLEDYAETFASVFTDGAFSNKIATIRNNQEYKNKVSNLYLNNLESFSNPHCNYDIADKPIEKGKTLTLSDPLCYPNSTKATNLYMLGFKWEWKCGNYTCTSIISGTDTGINQDSGGVVSQPPTSLSLPKRQLNDMINQLIKLTR